MTFADTPLAPSHLIRDRDGRFTAEFDQILKDDGVDTVRTQPQSPNMSAYCERVLQSIKSECLDHFVVFGNKHLRYLIDQYLAHYHQERLHQGLGNRPLCASADPPPPTIPFPQGEVVCRERLGGLLQHYYRQAA